MKSLPLLTLGLLSVLLFTILTLGAITLYQTPATGILALEGDSDSATDPLPPPAETATTTPGSDLVGETATTTATTTEPTTEDNTATTTPEATTSEVATTTEETTVTIAPTTPELSPQATTTPEDTTQSVTLASEPVGETTQPEATTPDHTPTTFPGAEDREAPLGTNTPSTEPTHPLDCFRPFLRDYYPHPADCLALLHTEN